MFLAHSRCLLKDPMKKNVRSYTLSCFTSVRWRVFTVSIQFGIFLFTRHRCQRKYRKRKPNNQPRSNPRRNVGRIRTLGGNREENNNEGTGGSGSSTAQGFTARSGNENPRGNGGGRRNGGFVASIERMLGITGRTVTLPGMDRPVRLIYLIFVALVGVLFGWKAVLGIAVLYFIQQRSNRTQQ